MRHPFFPDPVFAWTFCIVLLAITGIAAYIDFRFWKVPKWVTLPMLGLGLLFNLVRGIWLGANGKQVWILGEHGWLAGMLDGILFALAGFAAAFGIFLFMWILKTCGGGDVKLFAAVGAWVGPLLAFEVLIATLAIVCVMVFGRVIKRFLVTGKMSAASLQKRSNGATDKEAAELRRRERWLSYSLPVALSTAMVLLWVFRVELQLVVRTLNEAQPLAVFMR